VKFESICNTGTKERPAASLVSAPSERPAAEGLEEDLARGRAAPLAGALALGAAMPPGTRPGSRNHRSEPRGSGGTGESRCPARGRVTAPTSAPTARAAAGWGSARGLRKGVSKSLRD